MALSSIKHKALKSSLGTLSKDDLFRIEQYKKYHDPIILRDNTVVDITKEGILYETTSYNLTLPCNKSKDVFYFDGLEGKNYYYIEGSRKNLIKGYHENLEVYDVSLDYENSNTLTIVPYIVEYKDSEKIKIKKFSSNKIKFSPEPDTNSYEILLHLEGYGFIYNVKIKEKKSYRKVVYENNIIFSKNHMYNPDEFINFEENDKGCIMSVQANDKSHTYISYKENNLSFSEKPYKKVDKKVDFSKESILNLTILKDATLEIIPMLIEYSDTEKINIQKLDLNIDQKINFHKDTKQIRIAFRVNGFGRATLKSLKWIVIEEVPTTEELLLTNRSQVLEIISPAKDVEAFKVACIMDEFTYNSFEPEVELFKLSLRQWKSELIDFQPDLLFIESAWLGNDGEWSKKVGYFNDQQFEDISKLIKYAKEVNIPVIFWNKEDPVHYHRFIETAKLCDYVFTTDVGRVKSYKEDCGHGRVYALPFAAQPKNHNPIKRVNIRKSGASFAGSYYKHHIERSIDMDKLLEASRDIGLTIYDRNYEKTKNGEMPNHQFPEQFQPYIKGSLPFNLIDLSYKGYKFMINVNTVKNSETMFSRRVYEGLISGTPIISNYSVGMDSMFGNIINSSSNVDMLRNHLNNLDKDDILYNKYAVLGVREILLNHTYELRMKKILEKAGYNIQSHKSNITFVCFVNNDKDIRTYIDIFNKQKVSEKRLLIIHNQIDDYQKFYNDYNSESLIGISFSELSQYTNLTQLLGDCYLAVLNNNNFYGKNYALDLILASKYTDASIIGKGEFFKLNKNQEILSNNSNLQYQYTTNLLVDRSIINIRVFDKIEIDSALSYLNNNIELSYLLPYGSRLFSNDIMNFVEGVDEKVDFSKITV